MTDLATSLRDLRDVPLADAPAEAVAQVVRHITRTEPTEPADKDVAAFNSSI